MWLINLQVNYAVVGWLSSGFVQTTLQGRPMDATADLVEHIRQEISSVDLWNSPHRRTVLRNWVIRFRDDTDGHRVAGRSFYLVARRTKRNETIDKEQPNVVCKSGVSNA